MWGVGVSLLAAMLLCTYPTVSALTLNKSGQNDTQPPKETAMAGELGSFPFQGVSNRVAGAEGTPDNLDEDAGLAHDTTAGKADAPCDMSGNVEGFQPGEDPTASGGDDEDDAETEGGWSDSGMNDDGVQNDNSTQTAQPAARLIFSQQYLCRATSHWPEISPKPLERFNLKKAQFEGNNRRGKALPSEYTATSCRCKCSGKNRECGLPGSKSFYSGVYSSQACAQMICHENMFDMCEWEGTVVSRGSWIASTMHFNSTVLLSSEGPPEPVAPPAPAFVPASSSPSPSPPPSFKTVVVKEATRQFVSILRQVCVNVPTSLLFRIHVDLALVDIHAPNPVVCVRAPSKEVLQAMSSGNADAIRDAMQADEYAANHFAGLSDSSPVYTEGSQTSADMNTATPTNELVQTAYSTTDSGSGASLVDPQSFYNATVIVDEAELRLVRLLEDKVPKSVQCAPNVPSIAELIHFSRLLNESTSCKLVPAKSGSTVTVLSEFAIRKTEPGNELSEEQLYIQLVDKLKEEYLLKNPPSPPSQFDAPPPLELPIVEEPAQAPHPATPSSRVVIVGTHDSAAQNHTHHITNSTLGSHAHNQTRTPQPRPMPVVGIDEAGGVGDEAEPEHKMEPMFLPPIAPAPTDFNGVNPAGDGDAAMAGDAPTCGDDSSTDSAANFEVVEDLAPRRFKRVPGAKAPTNVTNPVDVGDLPGFGTMEPEWDVAHSPDQIIGQPLTEDQFQ